MTLTPEQLLAIRKRADAATPGPWTTRYGQRQLTVERESGKGLPLAICADWDLAPGYTPSPHSDAEFMAAARSDIPALLDEVERLRKQLDQTLVALGRIGMSMNPEELAVLLKPDG